LHLGRVKLTVNWMKINLKTQISTNLVYNSNIWSRVDLKELGLKKKMRTLSIMLLSMELKVGTL
jgi:hypothetical protein